MSTRDRRPEDFAAEIEAHIAHEAERLIEEGVPREEAWAAARRRFGNLTATRERFYESHRWMWLEQLWRDIAYAARSLRNSRVFALVAIASLALGIGANTAVFSLIDALMLKTLPVRDPQELRILTLVHNDRAVIRQYSGYDYRDDGGRRMTSSFSYEGFRRLQDAVDEFSTVIGYGTTLRGAVTAGGSTALAGLQTVSGNYFSALGVAPLLGRALVPADDRPEAPRVAMVTYRFWERRLGRDPEAAGSTIFVNRQPVTVAGVLPPAFQGLVPGSAVEVFVPLVMAPEIHEFFSLTRPDIWWVQAFARLRPGVSEAAAATHTRAALAPLIEQYAPGHASPEIVLEPGDMGVRFMRLVDGEYVAVVSVVAGLVLLICSVNLTNLLLGRGVARRREIAVRLSIGAGRWRVARQLLMESLLLCFTGGALGLAIAWPLLDVLVDFVGAAAWLDPQIDWRTLGFTAAASLLTALVFGTLPAWQATRVDLTPALKDGGAGGRHTSRSAASRVLVSAQVAISLVLVVGAALLARTLIQLNAVDLGFRPDHLLVFQSDPQTAGYKEDRLQDVLARMQDALAAIPGVTQASLSSPGLMLDVRSNPAFYIPGRSTGSNSDAYVMDCSASFLETVGIDLLAGRGLLPTDRAGSESVAVVNESFAREHFPAGDAVGGIFRLGTEEQPRSGPIRIVGIARDAHYTGVRDGVPATIYLPYTQVDGLYTMSFVMRTPLDPASLAPAVRQTITAIDPAIPVAEMRTEEAQIDLSTHREQLLAGLLTAFAALAALLAAIGLYGVLAYAVTRRTAEFGIRLALGATRGNVRRLVLRSSLVMIAAGLVVGLSGALAFTKVLDSYLFGVTARDAASFAVAAGVMLGVGMLAAWLPARRAARVDPLTALRHE